MTAAAVPVPAAAPDPRRWWTLVVLCLSLLVVGIDNTILNVALPSLERDLGASASELQWIVDAYMLVFAGLLLTAGALGDRFGRKRALTFGLLVFAAGSTWASLADTAGSLIAARALMGVGGAFIMPSTLSILTNVFPPHERGRAIGIWAAMAGLGIVIGPVSGGWLLEHATWHAIFLVNLPFVAVALAGGRRLVPESRDPAAGRLDLRGFALSTTGLTALVWAIIEAPAKGWTDPAVLGAFGLAAATLAAFAAWELRAPQPMLDVRLFANRRFSAASGSIALVFFALFGSIFFLTQYLQLVLGYDPLEAGIRVLPVAAGVMLGGPLSARLAERVGTKLPVVAGLALVGSGLVIMSFAEVDSGYGLIAASMSVLGLGMGLGMAPATDSIMGSLPLAKASVGSAVNDATRITGGALGVAILGSLLASHYRGDMEPVASALPGAAGAAAQDSLSGALAVAGRVGGQASAQLTEAAQSAFVGGMHVAALVAAGVAFAGAILALVALPARAAETPDAPCEPERARETVPA